MMCPRPGCGNMAFERTAHAHGHEIVESYCVAGHAQFVSSRPLKQLVEQPLDQRTLDEIEQRREIYGTFSCGHVRVPHNRVKLGRGYVCYLCTHSRRSRQTESAETEL
jgi:hypothetical protein